jgi:hypothetical protein
MVNIHSFNFHNIRIEIYVDGFKLLIAMSKKVSVL